MTDPASLWTRWWIPAAKRLARALSSAVASGLSASRAIVRPGLLVALLIVLVPLCAITIRSELHASTNTITVNNTTDPATTSGNGFCTLREAIDNANAKSDTTAGDCAAGAGTDTINFSVSGTITLGSGLPAIVNTLTIDGTGQTVTIDGASSFGILVVDSLATLNLQFLTLADGKAKGTSGTTGGNAEGGAISNQGTLTVTNCTFSDNASGWAGGGIFNDFGAGTLTVTNCIFSGNTGGLSATGAGAAIDIAQGTGIVTNSTFSGNSGYTGGGIFNESTLTVTDSTFSGNSDLDGGGIFNTWNFVHLAKLAPPSSCFASELRRPRVRDEGR